MFTTVRIFTGRPTPWVAIQASRCARRVDRILALKNPGVSLRPSYENGGRVVPPGTIVVLWQDITGENGWLIIRYPVLIWTIYWVALAFKFQELCRPSLGALLSVFWVCYDHSMRGNVKFITNFWLSLTPVNWNFVDRFLDVQQGPCSSRQLAMDRCCEQ